jgi:hypothetical protein
MSPPRRRHRALIIVLNLRLQALPGLARIALLKGAQCWRKTISLQRTCPAPGPARHRDSLPAFYIPAEATENKTRRKQLPGGRKSRVCSPTTSTANLTLPRPRSWFGQIDLARKTLERVAPRAQDQAAFHIVAGWLARAEGNLAEQEQQFDIAVNKDPNNDLYKFNLAALQIRSQDPEKSAQARANLERLTQVTQFRTGALRALLNDAVDRNDLQNADRFAQQLQMSPQVSFGDYLSA